MFPSSGYFRGVHCPFYASGLCERPYCHFRHSRTETERSTKAETGPNYSTSSGPSYSSSVGSILRSVTDSLVKDSPTYSPTLPVGLVEPNETSSNQKNYASDIDNSGSELNERLSIPSFSSTVPTLPESENEAPTSIASLPPISGLPKVRKNLPSYVPTPKAFGTLVGKDKDCVPSYIPTPKDAGDEVIKKSGRVIEYDPLKNFSLNDSHKSSEDEEAAFSSDEDNEAVNAGENSEKTKLNLENEAAECTKSSGCKAATAEDDLTDSDEEDTWQTSTNVSSYAQEISSSFSDLLTPSSFFTEKHTKVCSNGKSKSKYQDPQEKVLSKQSAAQGTKESRQHSSSKAKESRQHSSSKRRLSSEKDHKCRDSQRSNSSKNSSSSSHSQSASSNHKSSSSTSLSSKEKEKSAYKKSSSSSLGSSSHSISHRDKYSSPQSIKSPPTSSSSQTNIKPDSHKSSLSSSTPSSSSKSKESHSKNLHRSSSKNPKLKSPQSSSLTVSDKPQSSSSEKENKHSSKYHRSSSKSHSVSRSLSSSSTASTSSKRDKSKHTHVERSQSLDKKISTDISKNKPNYDQKPTLILNAGYKKTSLIPKDSLKKEQKHDSLKTCEIPNVKMEKNVKDKKACSKVSSTLSSKRSKPETKGVSSSRSSRGSGEDKKSRKNSKSAEASDSDIEIIEPPPPPVYSISDSDEDGGHNVNTVDQEDEEETAGMDSDTELSTNNDIDLMSDSDTFDECLRIFQESERQMAKKQSRDGDKICPEKRKAQETLAQETELFESSENLLVSVGKKRMAHKNSEKIPRSHKPLVPTKPRLSPAQVMHNRIIEMQKRALLRAAKKEGRESELTSILGDKEKSSSNGISIMGGGLPAASLLSRKNMSNGTASTTSASKSGISPSLIPPTGQRHRQAHVPGKALFPGEKTPPRKPAPSPSYSNGREKSNTAAFSMSPNSFYNKKAPPSSGLSRTATVAGTASKTEKRKAHEPTLSNLKRPLIPADFGSKVPTNVRQRYLNLIIDEHLKFRPESEAFAKGEEDEKAVYQKANNKNIYLGVAVNTIKRIRQEAAQFLPSNSKKPKLAQARPHATQSHAATLGGPNAARQSFTLNRSKTATVIVPSKIEGKELYNRLKPYILTEEQLRENGYPRPGVDGSSKVQFYKEENIGESLKENERVCRRCGTRFNVTKDGTPISNNICVYHYGSAYKKRVSGAIESRYGCCNEKAGTKGCQVASCHVHEQNKVDNRSGYMKTIPASSTSEKNYKVYALDCEMVYTKAGLELARVTVVGDDNQVVYESLVKPDTDIIDF
ncbi:hypothetical protein EGW08_007064, partial [Elysia chlorotica]